MANKDLFKQAIAEAKSIREAAIANAKEALEETLTPHLKDMLAAKLQEMEDSTNEEEVINEAEEELEETVEETVEEGSEEEAMEEAADEEEAEDDSEESEDEAEEEEAEEEDAEEGDDQEVSDMDVDELKDLIRDIVAQELGDSGEEVEDHGDMDAGDLEAGDDETIDLDELLAELDELSEEETHEGEEMEEGVEEEVEEVVAEEEDAHEGKDKMEEELNEALNTIESLRTELNEVNLLNAKLLYVNKIFKSNELSENQKVNVIAAFDKAETVKEVKLVYETVSENVVTKKQTSTIKESKYGMASKATGTTAAKPEVINEVSDAVLRMQKLAGIIK